MRKRACERIFINFLQISFSILLISAFTKLFNVYRSETDVENTFAFRCPHKKKSHGVRSGLCGGHKNTACNVIRWSPNVWFLIEWSNWLCMEWPCPVKIKFILGQLNVSLILKKKVFNISSYCTELTLTVSPFSSAKKRSDDTVLWNGLSHSNQFRMWWFCNLPIWINSRPGAQVCLGYGYQGCEFWWKFIQTSSDEFWRICRNKQMRAF